MLDLGAREVGLFHRNMPTLTMVDEDDHGREVPYHPLSSAGLVRSTKVPLLASLPRQVLAIPSSQAQSGHLGSGAGLIVTCKRNPLSADNVKILVSRHQH